MPSMAQSMKATTTLLTRREARTSMTLTTLRTLDLTLTTMMSHLVLAMATSLGLASAMTNMVMATIVHDSCRFDFFFADKRQYLKYTTINNWNEIKLSKTFVLPNDQAFKLDNTS